MAQSSPMNSGGGTYSYANNSTMQRDGLKAAGDELKEAIIENFNVEKLLSNSSSTTFTITDLGCSIGPNTFFAMQTIIDTIQHKHSIISQNQGSNHNLEFQIFFSDQKTNDFNTLFASLPPSNYFAAGVPGSFYGRLFPSSSIHIACSFYALHWMSRVPKELLIKNSPAWNTGKIHYTGSCDAVVKAYADQYEEDIGDFLSARAQEIVGGGMIIILMPAVADEVLTHPVGLVLAFLGSILMEMVSEGLLNQDEVDSFNVLQVFPSVKQMRRVVEKNGCFQIVKMELRDARPNKEAPLNIESVMIHMRAALEGTIANHFGSEKVDELFKRAVQQKDKFSSILYSSPGIKFDALLFAVLKRI